MTHPPDHERISPADKLERSRFLTRLSILWERATIAFWRVDCWIALFAALWMMQIPSILGKAGDLLALAVFFAGLAILLFQARRHPLWPGRDEADRRLEKENNLRHRPLQQAGDRLANPLRETTRKLWDKEKSDAATALRNLRIPAPRPVLAGADRAALHVAAFLLVVIGAVVAGPQWQERLAYGIIPLSVRWEDRLPGSANIVIWIKPPDYTALPQINIQGTGTLKESVSIPAGSTIKARVSKGFGTPALEMGDIRLPMQPAGKGSWSIETPAVAADRLRIVQMFMARLSIPVTYVPDQPPVIVSKGKPATMPKGGLQIPLGVTDDYGVTGLSFRMTLDPQAGDAPPGLPYAEDKSVYSTPKQETALNPVYDLSWHPWAGLPVVIEITARDRPGQVAALPPIHAILPERLFHHPVAQKLVGIRKRLLWTPRSAIPNAASELSVILSRPEQFGDDFSVFLSIRSMISRLNYSPTEESAIAIVSQLWDTALRIEDGNLTLAARNLRDAQQELERLLADPNATDEQIAAAMEKMQSALVAYMQELYMEMQKQASERGETPQALSQESLENAANMEDLSSFLSQMRAEALSGNREQALNMLSRLRQMTEQLDPSAGMNLPPQMQEMMESMKEMEDLIKRQEALLELTRQYADGSLIKQTYPDFIPFDEERSDMPPPPQAKNQSGEDEKPDLSSEKDEQEALRFSLGGLMQRAGEQMEEIPESLQEAEQEMRGSSQELGNGAPNLSVPHQEKVLEHLKNSQEQMGQQLAKMMKQMTFLSFGSGPLDPLGRPMSEGNGNNPLYGSQVKIPDEAQRKRAHEIMKILRQRSGELGRPDYERDYYHRLLRQF